jgi:hypothetical protein
VKEEPRHDRFDVVAQKRSDGNFTLIGNAVGRTSVQDLLPETPIDWKPLAGAPSGWRYITIQLGVGFDINRIATAIMDRGSRVVIKQDDKYILQE